MEMTEQFATWTARLSMTLYCLSLGLRLTSQLLWARRLWLAGSIAMLLHLACALHHHHWSQAEAWNVIATRTRETTGLDWGGGLYINYLFALVWLGDAAWWQLRPVSYLARPALIEAVIQSFLAFIAFNATVVFGSPPVRWAGGAAGVVLLLLWIGTRTRAGQDRLQHLIASPANHEDTGRHQSSHS